MARLHGEGPVKRRIMDMGITKGVQIYVRKGAPLGDPMELTVRNYEPVSYTHLDVYKRQACTTAPARASARGTILLPRSSAFPVWTLSLIHI